MDRDSDYDILDNSDAPLYDSDDNFLIPSFERISDSDDSDYDHREGLPVFVNRYSEEELNTNRIIRANKNKLVALETLCIRVAANYALEYHKNCVKGELDHNVVNGPFEKLPFQILNKIYNQFLGLVKKDKIILEITPKIFITQHTQRLEIRSVMGHDEEISVVKSKCQETLRKLTFNKCSSRTDTVLFEILDPFKALVELNFNDSFISDKIMEYISINMKSLSELKIIDSRGVTEKGLKYLLENKMENLTILMIRDVFVKTSLLMEILMLYPNLTVLDHRKTCGALKLLREAFPDKKTKLEFLEFPVSGKKKASSYTSIMECCPDLTHIAIVKQARNEYRRGEPIPVSPWFESSSVTKVQLVSVTVNITEFFSAFPNIEFLNLFSCKLLSTGSTYKKEQIKKLKQFSMYNCQYQRCVNIIKDIFYSTNLEQISLSRSKYARKLISDSCEPMHFNRLIVSTCLDCEWLEEIIMRNKNLEFIKASDLPHTGHLNLNFDVNKYLDDILQGKVTLFSQTHRQFSL